MDREVSWETLTPSENTQLMRHVNSSDVRRFRAVLKEHELFRILKGNPHSIQIVACLRANPQFNLTLPSIFLALKSTEIQDILAAENIDVHIFENSTSLKISHEIALLTL